MADAYADYAITKGASEVFPLVDIASGTTIHAYVNSARNGVQTGWALQNAAGPVTGTLAPYSDGSNDYGDLYTSNGSNGLIDIWNGQLFSILIWAKADNWTGTGARRLVDMRADGSNLFLLDRQTGSTLRAQYRANGTTKTVAFNSGDPAGWFSFGFSVSLGADEMKVFYNGSQQGSTQTGLGIWSGTPASNNTLIGSGPTPPSTVWLGHVAYLFLRFGAIWTATDFADLHNQAAAIGGGSGALLASERNRLVR